MKLKNIKIKDFVKLQYTFLYDQAFEFVEPVNSFSGAECNFDALTFDEVTLVKNIMQDPSIENMPMLYEILYKKDFMEGRIMDFFQSKKWIDNKILEIIDIEEKLLFDMPDPKMIAAGAANLERFGVLNTKIDLGVQFGKAPAEIGGWTYQDVLLIKARNIEMNRIQKNYK